MLQENIIRLVRVPGVRLLKHFGKIYIFSSNETAFDGMRGDYFDEDSQKERIVSLEPTLVPDASVLDDAPLAEAIREEGANIVGEVLDARQGEPSFLMMRSSEDTLFDSVDILAYKMDKYNRDALAQMMGDLALNAPEECSALLKDAEFDPDMLPVERGGKHKNAEDLQKEAEEYRKRYVENMNLLRDPNTPADIAERAMMEVTVLISSLTKDTLGRVLIEITKSRVIPSDDVLKEEVFNLDNAAQSTAGKLVIRHSEEELKYNTSDGKYRISFEKGENAPIPIRFPGRVETALYITLLYNHKVVDHVHNVDLNSLQDIFIAVYRCLYEESEFTAAKKFEEIFYTINPDGTYGQGRSRNYFKNMRRALSTALMGEVDPSIYYYERGSRLHVLKDNIKISKGLQDYIENYLNPKGANSE